MSLPHEMISNIFSFMPNKDKLGFIGTLTNRRQLMLYKSILPCINYVIKHNWQIAKLFDMRPISTSLCNAVILGDMECVAWVYYAIGRCTNIEYDFTNALNYAAIGGYTECIQMIFRFAERDNIPYDNQYIVHYGGTSGNIEFLKYLWSIKNTYLVDFTDSGMTNAASNGHLDYIKYMIAIGISATTNVFYIAVQHNQVEILDYLYSLFPELLNQWCLFYAVVDSTIDVLKWMVSIGYPINQNIMDIAVSRKQPECIAYLQTITLV